MTDFTDTVVRRLTARTGPDSKRRLVMQGDLAAVSVPDVINLVSVIRHTGQLVFRRKEDLRVMLWSEGEIVFATTNAAQDSLGEFLLRNGKITEEQYKESLKRLTPGMRHGKLLVQMGHISPKDLWWGVRNHVLEVIYGLFSWHEGAFELLERETEIGERITLDMTTSSIIMEGIRRIDETVMIQEKIPSRTIVYRPVRGAAGMIAELDLNESEIALFEEIDGKRSVRDLVRKVDLTEFEILQGLYQLLSVRLIEQVQHDAPPKRDVEDLSQLRNVIDKYNQMFSRLFDAVSGTTGAKRAGDLFANALRNSSSNELWQGVKFDEKGRFDENMLIGNVSELPVDHRRTVLDDGLNNLLSAQLFETSPFLTADRKADVFQFISTQKAQLESAAS